MVVEKVRKSARILLLELTSPNVRLFCNINFIILKPFSIANNSNNITGCWKNEYRMPYACWMRFSISMYELCTHIVRSRKCKYHCLNISMHCKCFSIIITIFLPLRCCVLDTASEIHSKPQNIWRTILQNRVFSGFRLLLESCTSVWNVIYDFMQNTFWVY